MAVKRTIGNLVVILGLTVASFLPDSTLRDLLRYLALGYFSIDMLLWTRAGYLRRRPHWTRESWRRYLTACVVPICNPGSGWGWNGWGSPIDAGNWSASYRVGYSGEWKSRRACCIGQDSCCWMSRVPDSIRGPGLSSGSTCVSCGRRCP